MMMERSVEATASLRSALDAVRGTGDDYRETTLLSTLGYIAVRAGMGAEALEYYCRVRERSIGPGMEVLAIEGLVGTGHSCRILGDLKGAVEAYSSALENREELPEELRIESTGYLGMVTVADGRVEEGEKMLDEAIALSSGELPTFDRALWLLEKGDLLMSRGELEAVEEYVGEVLKMNLIRFDTSLRRRAEKMAEEIRPAAVRPDGE
jgi:tetratricopeptide (TPR) repeat protein